MKVLRQHVGDIRRGDQLGRRIDDTLGEGLAGKVALDLVGDQAANTAEILGDAGFEVTGLGDGLQGLRIGVDTGNNDAFTFTPGRFNGLKRAECGLIPGGPDG